MSPHGWLVQALSDHFAFGHLTPVCETMVSESVCGSKSMSLFSPASSGAGELQCVCHFKRCVPGMEHQLER